MKNYRKWMHLVSIMTVSLVLMMKYQNCGSTAAMDIHNAENGLIPNNDIIDDSTTTTALTFLEKSIQINNSAVLEARGACFEEQNGALLNWALLDSEGGNVLEAGQTGCEAGDFVVGINDLSQMQCGREYLIQARLGLGQAGQVSVMIACN